MEQLDLNNKSKEELLKLLQQEEEAERAAKEHESTIARKITATHQETARAKKADRRKEHEQKASKGTISKLHNLGQQHVATQKEEVVEVDSIEANEIDQTLEVPETPTIEIAEEKPIITSTPAIEIASKKNEVVEAYEQQAAKPIQAGSTLKERQEAYNARPKKPATKLGGLRGFFKKILGIDLNKNKETQEKIQKITADKEAIHHEHTRMAELMGYTLETLPEVAEISPTFDIVAEQNNTPENIKLNEVITEALEVGSKLAEDPSNTTLQENLLTLEKELDTRATGLGLSPLEIINLVQKISTENKLVFEPSINLIIESVDEQIKKSQEELVALDTEIEELEAILIEAEDTPDTESVQELPLPEKGKLVLDKKQAKNLTGEQKVLTKKDALKVSSPENTPDVTINQEIITPKFELSTLETERVENLTPENRVINKKGAKVIPNQEYWEEIQEGEPVYFENWLEEVEIPEIKDDAQEEPIKPELTTTLSNEEELPPEKSPELPPKHTLWVPFGIEGSRIALTKQEAIQAQEERTERIKEIDSLIAKHRISETGVVSTDQYGETIRFVVTLNEDGLAQSIGTYNQGGEYTQLPFSAADLKKPLCQKIMGDAERKHSELVREKKILSGLPPTAAVAFIEQNSVEELNAFVNEVYEENPDKEKPTPLEEAGHLSEYLRINKKHIEHLQGIWEIGFKIRQIKPLIEFLKQQKLDTIVSNPNVIAGILTTIESGHTDKNKKGGSSYRDMRGIIEAISNPKTKEVLIFELQRIVAKLEDSLTAILHKEHSVQKKTQGAPQNEPE